MTVGKMTELHRLLQGVPVQGKGSEADLLRIFGYGMQHSVLSQGKLLGQSRLLLLL